jgi:hypothetical protein
VWARARSNAGWCTAATRLFASVVWFVLHDRSHANVVGTALVVAAALSMSWPGPAV